MSQLLRNKTDGSLFIYTAALAALPEMELVVEDPIAKVVEEVVATQSLTDEIDAILGDTFAGKTAQKKSRK